VVILPGFGYHQMISIPPACCYGWKSV